MVYTKSTKDYIVLFISTALIFGILFGFVFGVFYGIFMSIISENILQGFLWALGIMFLGGPFSGFFFGLLLTLAQIKATKKTEKLAERNRALFSMENKIVCEGPSSHNENKKFLPGWMFVSEDAVVFRTHESSTEHDLMISLSDIVKTEAKSNKLKIYTKSGATELFIAEKPKLWKQSITSVLNTK